MNILKKQELYQIQKKHVKPKLYIPIIAKYPNEIHQIDLLDISNISTTNKNVKFFLVDIDVFTRKLQVVPMKNKKTDSVIDAMKEIISENKPTIIQSDHGSEFISKEFKTLMKENNIEIQYVDVNDHHKLSI